jgi:Tol biopolymer transport system component
MTPTVHAANYPPSYRWRTIETEHFLVHFHQGEEDLAQRAAAIAERAHTNVVPLIGWTPRERTHLILTDHVDVSNGSATTFPHNRIEIYVSAPGADPSSAIEYYDNWLDLVITHEYAHILHLDQSRGVSAAFRKVFGRNPYLGFPNQFSPLWLIEGLATVVESEMTTAGRLKGTFLEMILRTAAIEGRFATQGQAGGATPAWPGGNTRYFYGAKFLSWLAAREGADKLRAFLNEYSSNVIPFRVDATSKDVYGTDMKSLWRQWSGEQQLAYRAEHARLVSEGLTATERLTRLGYETKYPLLSPDGSRLAYSHRGPYERATIRVRDVATGSEVSEKINSDSALGWSSDGLSIAYSQLEFFRSSVISDLYVWTVDGGSRRITHNARLKDPSFTPDNRSLVAVENRAGRNRLVEVDVATGAVRPILSPDGYTQFSEPAVSHDGTRIAVAEWSGGSIDVVVYDRAGARIANLTASLPRATNASPRFSRDDSTIYFSSDVTGIPNVFSVPASGGEIRRLTNMYGGAFYPTTADGRRFYISDYSAEGWDVAMFEASRTYDVARRTIPESVIGRTERVSRDESAAGVGGAPLDSAAYSALRSLRPRWWFPVVSDSGVGATTSGGDVLGFHNYVATATAGDDAFYSFIYAYDRLYPTITAGALRFEDGADTTGRLLAEATLPVLRYRWQSSATVSLLRDDLEGSFNGVLQGIRVGGTFNNAQRYPYSVSSENGVTARAGYETLRGDASVQRVRGDVRGYLTIPYRRSPLGRHVIATRVAAAQNSGDFIAQRELRVGGNEDVGFPALDTSRLPVRGYDSGTLRGQGAAIASVEYRFPIYEIERGPATLPIFFNRIVGDVFVDAGRAWRQRSSREAIASTGVELGVDFHLAHAIPLRYVIGFAWLLRDPGKGDVQPYFAVQTGF